MTLRISSEFRQQLRQQFPSLAGETIFLENAGGSQVPAVVADGVRRYMVESYVQVGAGHALSKRSSRLMARAHEFAKLLMNGHGGEVILGPSTSVLLQMLADCYGRVLAPGQEIIVAQTGHEANVGPWVRLERSGLRVRWWEVDVESCSCPIERLRQLLTTRTALVALPHVSNLLGEITDLRTITDIVHDAGARVVVDGVAYAPHRAMDVADWGVDWYAYSTYKVYGPHMAVLWGRDDALGELAGPNHFFIRDAPAAFELGGVCHESCAGFLALADYLKLVAGAAPGDEMDRPVIERCFDVMTACELPLQKKLIGHLLSRPEVRIVGPRDDGPGRVGTVSFIHRRKSSREVTAVVDRSAIAIRHGHMYAYRLCEALGLDPEDGVVRVSLVHYNSPEEIDRLIAVLDQALE